MSSLDYLYSLHKVFSPNYQTNENPFILPQTVAYALIDFDDTWVKGEMEKNKSNFYFVSRKLQQFILHGPWFLKESVDNGYTPLGYNFDWWSCKGCQRKRGTGHDSNCRIHKIEKLLKELDALEEEG